ncbi:MAG: hypothetical protein GC152_04385 [Alphaproteobacteria bacterium]|nr:hypothetical protein [Alphaproteobacteria bacterium]
MTFHASEQNRRRRIDTECTVTVRHTEETLEAHVVLDDGLLPAAGDRITVFGDPIRIDYGHTATFKRRARLERGGVLAKLRVRLASFFQLTELYEVSFSDGRL